MEASCVFSVKVGMVTHLEQSKISLLTDNKMGIVRITIQLDLIVSVSIMYYPGDCLRQRSAAFLTLDQCSIYSKQSCNLVCCTPQLTSVDKQTTSDQFNTHLGAVGNPCNLPLYPAGFILSMMNMLAATCSILT